jgi:hypothetical protein
MREDRRFRSAAWLLLAAWIVGVVAPVADVVHAFGDDPACQEPVFSPHPITQIEGVLPPVAHGHCLVCHFQRTLRGATPHVAGVTIHVFASDAAVDRPIATVRAVALGALLTRAPPSL